MLSPAARIENFYDDDDDNNNNIVNGAFKCTCIILMVLSGVTEMTF